MKHQTLHEIAKFASGLVLGDFFCLWWISSQGMLPLNFLGITFTEYMVLPGMIFDAALFVILVYYGWHLGHMPSIRERSFLLIAGTVFGIVALAHLIRVFFGFDLIIGTWEVPLWLSWTATVATAFLSYISFRIASRSLCQGAPSKNDSHRKSNSRWRRVHTKHHAK